jgi:magnesium chelatase subunit H
MAALLAKLRGAGRGRSNPGARQLALLRRIPKILRFIPGPAQDLRAYFLTLQYWLAGSEENLVNLVRYLVDRYAEGPRRHLRGTLSPQAPVLYPDVGAYHPRLPGRIIASAADLPASGPTKGTVGLLVMRAYVQRWIRCFVATVVR